MIDLLNAEEVAFIEAQIAAGVWPEDWEGDEITGDAAFLRKSVVLDEDGNQRIETQLDLWYRPDSHRRAYPIAYYPRPARLDPWRSQMGVLSDYEIARRSGVSRSVVREMRRRMHIPAVRQ